jgi:hypothetical protein
MSDPSLSLLENAFLYSFEINGPLDEHQERNARRGPGVPCSFSLAQLRADLFITAHGAAA